MAIITPDPTAPGGLARTVRPPRARGGTIISSRPDLVGPARRVRRDYFSTGQALPQALVRGRPCAYRRGDPHRALRDRSASESPRPTPAQTGKPSKRSAPRSLARLAEINALLGGGSGLRVTGSGGGNPAGSGSATPAPLSPLGEEIEKMHYETTPGTASRRSWSGSDTTKRWEYLVPGCGMSSRLPPTRSHRKRARSVEILFELYPSSLCDGSPVLRSGD